MRGHQSQSSADTLQTATGKAYLVRDHATKDGGRAVVFTDITEKTLAETALARRPAPVVGRWAACALRQKRRG